MSDEKKVRSLLIHGVPMDVVDELDRRAALNFRQRTGEVISILAAVCRTGVAPEAPKQTMEVAR